MTERLRDRMRLAGGNAGIRDSEELFRAQLARLGYPAFAQLTKSRARPRPDAVLMAILSRADADARVVDSLPWIVATFQNQLDFGGMVRQAKLRNLQNRLGFVLEFGGVSSPEGVAAVAELEQARLLREDSLCWDSMPGAVREWLRGNRSPLARHWNVLTRVGAEEGRDEG